MKAWSPTEKYTHRNRQYTSPWGNSISSQFLYSCLVTYFWWCKKSCRRNWLWRSLQIGWTKILTILACLCSLKATLCKAAKVEIFPWLKWAFSFLSWAFLNYLLYVIYEDRMRGELIFSCSQRCMQIIFQHFWRWRLCASCTLSVQIANKVDALMKKNKKLFKKRERGALQVHSFRRRRGSTSVYRSSCSVKWTG